MPEIKFKHVVSCSSEEKGFPVDNIFNLEPKKVWKCTPGEKSAVVIIQLEKSCQIKKIDIGNVNSAFIEVLVGRESDQSGDYHVILPASAFMTPDDSRSGKNGGCVRNFGKDHLVVETADQKWDRVKIVCNQPFNKSIGYGVSFIRLVEEGKENEDSSKEKIVIGDEKKKSLMFGSFKLKADDNEEDSGHPGSMFAKRNEKSEDSPPLQKAGSNASAAAIRAASKAQDTVGMRSKNTQQHQASTTATTPVTTSRDWPYYKLRDIFSQVDRHVRGRRPRICPVD